MLTQDQKGIIINQFKKYETLMIQGHKKQAEGLMQDAKDYYLKNVEQTQENAEEVNVIYKKIKMNQL